MRYWLLVVDPEFCTIDDLRLSHHGWNFDAGGYNPSVLRGDVAVLFDPKKMNFRCLGRFMTGVAAAEEPTSDVRYDFLIDVTSRRQSPEALGSVRRRLSHPRHPLRSVRWLTKVLTRLTRAEFDDLIEAWWGVSQLSAELEETAAAHSGGNNVKYSAYAYAFERLADAIDRGYNLEAVALAESIISDRIHSACLRIGRRPAGSSLGDLIRVASQMKPALPKHEEFDRWRVDRNQVIHGIVKGSRKGPLLQTTDFLELAERTAAKGAILARTASAWSKKIK